MDKNSNSDYHYFSDRLKSKFGLHISRKKYRELCLSADFEKYGETENAFKVSIYYQSTKLCCYKSKKTGRLVTTFKRNIIVENEK